MLDAEVFDALEHVFRFTFFQGSYLIGIVDQAFAERSGTGCRSVDGKLVDDAVESVQFHSNEECVEWISSGFAYKNKENAVDTVVF